MTEGNCNIKDLEGALDAILTRFRVAVNASRTTVRIDDPVRGWSVALPCAEALAPGVASMREDGSINQRAAGTARWLAVHKTNLLQPDLLANPDPAPPAALLAAYGAKAQMLGPLLDRTGYLTGWISAHFLQGPVPLSDAEDRLMNAARADVARVIGLDR